MKKTIKITLILATFLLVFVTSTSLVFAGEMNMKDNFTNAVTGSAIIIESEEKDKEIHMLFSPSSTHIHTDSCHNGVKHTHTGSAKSGGGCYGEVVPGRTTICGGSYNPYILTKWTCSACGYSTSTITDESGPCPCDYGHWSEGGMWSPKPCTGTMSYNGTVTNYKCGSCGDVRTSISPGSTCSKAIQAPKTYKINCGKIEGLYYNDSGSETPPICHEVVISISAENQTIIVGEDISKTATATYLDGHTATVSCSASNFNKNTPGTYDVTLTYNGKVDNAKTTGTKSCNISVTVQSGLERITVIPSATTVYNGSKPTFTVKAYYGNEDIKTLSSGEYSESGWSAGVGTKNLVFSYEENEKRVEFLLTIIVNPRATSISSITPSATSVYNGSAEPTYTIVVLFENGSTKTLTSGFTKSGWSNGHGTKEITITYTEGNTVSNTVSIAVKPNVTGLTLSKTPSTSQVYYNDDILFTTSAIYEGGSTKIVTSTATEPYDKFKLGLQEVKYSYTENGKTVTSSDNITVLDYPTYLNITLDNLKIYQGQFVKVNSSIVTLASKATPNVNALVGSYDNITIGDKVITFTYELNGRSITTQRTIEILPDLYDLRLNKSNYTIYKGQDLDIEVFALFNIEGEVKLESDEFQILGFDKNIYDREGKNYTVTYTNKEVVITKTIFIKILPNISNLTINCDPQVLEGVHIPFNLIVSYEDGQTLLITEEGDLTNLSILNYNLDEVGYQDITFEYSEGDMTLSEEITIRVRAIINVSIPISALVNINPNEGTNETNLELLIENKSKEPIEVVLTNFNNPSNDFNNVLPDKYYDWSSLGVNNSKDIAIGISSKGNWMTKNLEGSMYVSEFNNSKSLGIIDSSSSSNANLRIVHGNSFKKATGLEVECVWQLKLVD